MLIQIRDNKTKLATIIATILLMASALMAMPVDAQQATNIRDGGSLPLPAGVTPDFQVNTNVFLSFRPNPVGLGQTILVNVWMEPPIHVTRYIKGYTVTITKPDETQDVITMDSYRGDSTAWFEYIADQTGTWKLKARLPRSLFPGRKLHCGSGEFCLSSHIQQLSTVMLL